MIKSVAERRAIIGIIRVSEYLAWKHPDILKAIYGRCFKYYSTFVNEDDPSFKEWKRLMEEPPKPGRAGGG